MDNTEKRKRDEELEKQIVITTLINRVLQREQHYLEVNEDMKRLIYRAYLCGRYDEANNRTN